MLSNNYFKNKWLYLVFTLFLIISAYGLYNHTPWRDEAQAWLIVRDLPIQEIIAQMPYEGTPPLWHLLILPLVKMGLPYESMLYLHYFIGIGVIFILLFYAPLPNIIKYILPFNYYFIFEYIIIARNYNLSALILFFIASVHHKRWEHPIWYGILIFLLAWTNVHSLVLAVILFLFFIYDIYLRNKNKQPFKRTYWLSVALSFLGLLSAFLILIPYPDQASTLKFNHLFYIGRSLTAAILPLLTNTNNLYFAPVIYWLLGAIWLFFIFAFLETSRSRIIFITSFVWLAFIFIFKHHGDSRHYGLILIYFIFAWWLDIKARSNRKNWQEDILLASSFIILIACFVASAAYSFFFYNNNRSSFFSGAKEMAYYLNSNPNLLNENIATYPSYSGSALLPYLPQKIFYQFETFSEGTFLTWNNIFDQGTKSPYVFLKNEMKKFYQQNKQNKDYVLLLTVIPPTADSDLELIHQNTRPTVKEDEYFYLYKMPLN